MRPLVDVQRYISDNWFIDRKELRKAREILLKYYPDTRDFNLGYYIIDNSNDKDIITADMLKKFINILVEDLKIYDSPFWIIHPVFCDNVTVRNVYIDSNNYNNDGCDPESCTNVLIEGMDFNVGDDGIAIKSGRDQDGWRIGQATENVIIRNCHFARWAITVGSEMSGGVRNIYIEDCKIDSCRNGIYFKSNPDRGGYFENLNMRRIEADVCLWGVINFRTNYHGYRGGNHPTLFRNICIEDVTCNRVDSVALMANGLPEAKLHNITLRNINVKKAPKAIQMENVVNLTLDNVVVNGEKVTAP